ncbi:serpentine type 7TM GPCR receptor class ab chemoreceptor domain-containing protein [Ditylenchus destructor]|uniref:Serpentine type 7TM GPCR receptor class ab chemoreceptor domain-containing protein n=1 Tax=Ditylenchus destructor TaxID=166010 RepID=A0AAD4QVZ3_9BILA|nr:serpentine type 7TM GPCR receptor class ab chemoreceptor domain-containing protein [Ditylenchus destructor]
MTSNSTLTYSSYAYADCDVAAKMMAHNWWSVVRIAQVVFSLISLVTLPFLALYFKRHHMIFHRNLSLLVINVFFLYVIECLDTLVIHLRYIILYYIAENPCEFLTEVWLVVVLRLPAYVYLIAFTLVHCAIAAERAWATYCAKHYEKVGCTFGVVSTILVWTITFALSFYIVLTALREFGKNGKPLLFLILTTPENSYVVNYMHCVLLFLVFMTTIVDYLVISQNRKYRHRLKHSGYSLSMNFQLRENIITMKLILPLDIFFTIIFTVYLIAATFMRFTYSFSITITPIDYMFGYELINALFPLHTMATLLLYMRYIKYHEASRVVKIVPTDLHKEIYFRQLQSEWS